MQVLKSADLFGEIYHSHYRHTVVRRRLLSDRRHAHEFYEMVLVVSGGTLHTLNGTLSRLTAGDLVVMKPGDWHCFSENSRAEELLSLQIEPGEMARFLAAYDMNGWPDTPASRILHLEGSEVRAIEEIYRYIACLDGDDYVRQYRILLGQIMQFVLAHDVQGSAPPWLRMAMEQMTHLGNAAEGVPAFLRAANLSHAQLCRLMKKHYGMTPQQYVRNLRLNLAYEMIQSSTLDFMTIAMEVGYSSFSHFQTAFKEKYGLSPAALRRQSLSASMLSECEAPR